MSLDELITDAVNTYLSSFEKQDVDGILNVFADDCWIEDPIGSERRVGKEALREFYQGAVGIGATMTLESEIRIAGNEAAFGFRLNADLPNGKLSVRPIDVMVFNDQGKVTSMRAYFGPANQSFES
jgi:steroid delta-isomerase